MLALGHHVFGARNTTLAALLPVARQLGFQQLSLTTVDSVPRPGPFAAAQRETGVRIVAVRAGCLDARIGATRLASEDLASLDAARSARAFSALAEHAAFARSVGCPLLLLDGGRGDAPGLDERVRHLEGTVARGESCAEAAEEIRLLARKDRDLQLDRLCRLIHRLAREHAEMRWALLPATRPDELLDADSARAVLADLRLPQLGVWVDVGRQRVGERLGCEPSVHVLATLAPHLVGLDLHDAQGHRDHLVPGDGEVDWRMVSEQAPRGATRVLSLETAARREDLQRAQHVLESLELA